MLDQKVPKLDRTNPSKMRCAIGTPLYMAPEQLKGLNPRANSKRKFDVGPFDDFKADVWQLGLLIYHVLTFTVPIDGGHTLQDMIDKSQNGIEVPELPNVMGFEEKTYNGFKEIVTGCLTQDPAKRFTAKQVQAKFSAMLKEAKIENPPASQEYTDADFAPFFKYIAGKVGKPEQELFVKHKNLLKMLGSIPIAIKKKIDIKSLPFHDEIIDKKGVKYMYQGNLDGDKQPKGLGCKWNEKQFEFGVYGEAPYCVTKLKVELDQVVIIPNSQKPMKTSVCSNGVVQKGYGHVFGKISFPDGRYYEGGFEKDGDFKGVGKYLFSNGDFYHGEWKNSKMDGLGKYFSKAEHKMVFGTFKNQLVGINPKDLKDLDPDVPAKVDKEMKHSEWKKAVQDKDLAVYFF